MDQQKAGLPLKESGPGPVDASVIIPTYNRCDALRETLEALARVEYPPDLWEAVVVDDGSTDETEKAVRLWAEQRPAVTVRFLRQRNAGPAMARNRGAGAARGNLLIFIDNDIIVEPSFVRAHLEAHAAHPDSWIVGRITHPAAMRGTPFGRYRDDCWEGYYADHSAVEVEETAGMSAANVSIPAADFRRLGGFDEDFTIASSEDWDLGMRARRAGIRVLYHPGIKVLHNDWAGSLDQFCRRQMLYSISDVLLWQKYGEDSLRAALIRANAPVAWGRDPARLVTKKALKAALSTRPGRWGVRAGCALAERLAPDTRWSRRLYDAAVAIAIFQGVRQGLKRYGPGSRTANAESLITTGR
jgi:GT2 family glycosyltransferase